MVCIVKYTKNIVYAAFTSTKLKNILFIISCKCYLTESCNSLKSTTQLLDDALTVNYRLAPFACQEL